MNQVIFPPKALEIRRDWVNSSIKYSKNLWCFSTFEDGSDLDEYFSQVHFFDKSQMIKKIQFLHETDELPDAILFLADSLNAEFAIQLAYFKHIINSRPFDLPLFVICNKPLNKEIKALLLKNGADDCFSRYLDPEKINNKIDFIKKLKSLNREVHSTEYKSFEFKMDPLKRGFDILLSGLALTTLSPLMLGLALLIRLESSGPVFYVSKRAGKGYDIFNFLKFRTMKTGADKELQHLKHLNQYGDKGNGDSQSFPVFFKIENDPRVTRLGNFLRSTSLDELPQLINVLKGDMSIVGNRPLPLYEAQQLTQDQYAMRFFAPAGITGLWQVTKRGKKDLSGEERIELDINYAQYQSFRKDISLIAKTFPALIQEAKV